MSVPMSKDEIETTLLRLEELNNSVHDAHYDRVIDRMVNYMLANIDDFIECYDDCEDDEQPYDIYLKHDCELHDTDSVSNIIGGGQG